MQAFKESELILNPDGSIYHLKLRPEHVAHTLFVVGDQGRVELISRHFDRIEHRVQNREFVTHTGMYRNKRVTALSTGIGTDNIDIVINELDALVNIDLERRIARPKPISLNIIRLGTSGALQPDIPVDSVVASAYGLGFDGLLQFYRHDDSLLEKGMTAAFIQHMGWDKSLPDPYIVEGSRMLLDRLDPAIHRGITATANGFYGPQGRQLRIPLAFPQLNDGFGSFRYEGHRIINFEMETSALFALGSLLGHQTITLCAVIANRSRKEYSRDYSRCVDEMIAMALDRLLI